MMPLLGLEIPSDIPASQRLYSAIVEADVGIEPTPRITLQFLDHADGFGYVVHRRLHGEVDWGMPLAELPPSTMSWTDTQVIVGTIYEYQVRKQIDDTEDAVGYVASGIEVDRTAPLGRLLLVVDETLAVPLASELLRLVEDLVDEGWTVERLDVPRAMGWQDDSKSPQVPAVKQGIVNAWNAAPLEDKPRVLFLLGHIPVPRSGLDGESPDDHPENRGAHPTDSFYADIDGTWTDTGTAPEGMRLYHDNIPGDGKLDQDFLPSPLEMAVGRVDFADLGGFYSDIDEIGLLRRYLDKLHAYRRVLGGSEVGRRSLFIRDGYVESVEMCWRSYAGISGAEHTQAVTFSDVDAAGGPVSYVATFGPYMLFAQNQRGPLVFDHISQGSNALIWSSDQSYFGLWGRGDSDIRGALASPGINLAWIWHVAPSYVFTDLAMGGLLGDAVRRTIEHRPDYLLWERPIRDFDDPPVYNRNFMALMGDPSLRVFQVAPVEDVVASLDDLKAAVELEWAPSPEDDLVGYHVYRAGDRLGPYQRVTADPVTETSFSEPFNSELAHYQVKAVKRETTGGGSFLNPSIGTWAEVQAKGAVFSDGFESGDTELWASTSP